MDCAGAQAHEYAPTGAFGRLVDRMLEIEAENGIELIGGGRVVLEAGSHLQVGEQG